MATRGAYMNGASPVNNMALHQEQEKTIGISMADVNMIKKKFAAYETRLKAFQNLQGDLAKRDKELANCKKEAKKYEVLARKYEELYTHQCQVNTYLKQLSGQQDQFQQQMLQQPQLQQQPDPQRLSPQHLPLQQQHSPQQGQQSPQGQHSPQQGQHSPQYQMQHSPQQQMQPSPQQQMQPSPQYQMQPSPQQEMQHSPQQQMQPSPQHQGQLQGHMQVQPQGQAHGHLQGQIQGQPQGQQLPQAPFTNGVHAPQTLPTINHMLQPVGSHNFGQPIMQSEFELLSHGIGGCASEAERQYSNSDFLSLERVLAEINNCPEGAALRPGIHGYHYQDVQVDGEEEVSLASIQESLDRKSASNQPEETSDRPSRPTMPVVSQKVLQEIVQNNLRLQKTLQEVAAVKGSSHSKLEYERVITNLRSQLAVAEDRYKDVQSATSHLENGDQQKVGELLKGYQNKIAYLQQIVSLKQSLHGMFVQDSNKEASKPTNLQGSKDEAAQTNDLESLTESFSQTSITDPSTAAAEVEAQRLASEISEHQEELRVLEQERRTQEAALEVTKQRTEAEKERLRQTEEQLGEGRSRHEQLLVQCKEQEGKLTKLKQEITLTNISRDKEEERKAAEKRAILEKEEMYMRQLQAYEEDYTNLKQDYDRRQLDILKKTDSQLKTKDSQLKTKDSQLKNAIEENDKLKRKLDQQRQYIDGLVATAKYQMSMGPVVKQPWMSQSHLPMVVTADGPSSSLSPSLRSGAQSSLGAPSINDRSPSPAKPLECPRCQREFGSVDYFREHVNKCTDA